MHARFPSAVLLTCLLITSLATAADDSPQPESDPTNIAFFEKLYDTKITGVKRLEDYDDPDSFYAAIAQRVGIPQQAFAAVEKRFGWKQDDGFLYAAVVKGGSDSPYWGVMVSRIPASLKAAVTIAQRKEALKLMELKFVVIDYEGNVSFPEEEKKKQREKDEAPLK